MGVTPYSHMHLGVPGMMACTSGAQALPGLPSSISSCNSLLPVRPCLSLNDLWLSMASVCRPEREDLSLWCIPFPTPGEDPTQLGHQHKTKCVEAPAEDGSISRGAHRAQRMTTHLQHEQPSQHLQYEHMASCRLWGWEAQVPLHCPLHAGGLGTGARWMYMPLLRGQ